MSQVIKVPDEVYEQLDQLRGKGETFGQVIEQLLGTRTQVLELMSVLEGQVKFQQWKDQRLQQLQALHR